MDNIIRFSNFGLRRGKAETNRARKRLGRYKEFWNWNDIAGKLLEVGFAVSKVNIRYDPGFSYAQRIGVPPDTLPQISVCRAHSWMSYHNIHEGGPGNFGQYHARLGSFAAEYRRTNNLMLVEQPTPSGDVSCLEFGVRRFSGHYIATFQKVLRSVADENNQGFLPLNHGLRKFAQKSWPDCGVAYEPAAKHTGQPPDELMEFLSGRVPVKVVWHSLRLGLIKARLKGGQFMFFSDRLLFKSIEDIKLLRTDRSLIYLPPRKVAEASGMFRMIGDYLALEKGLLIKPEPKEPAVAET